MKERVKDDGKEIFIYGLLLRGNSKLYQSVS